VPQSAINANKPSSGNRDSVNRLLYPLLSKLVAYIPRFIHPNILTLGAIISAWGAAAIFAFYPAPFAFLYCRGGQFGRNRYAGLFFPYRKKQYRSANQIRSLI